MQLETMAKLKGRGSRQRITVRKYSQHEHKHIHLHQGGVENGNQPHEPTGTRTAEIKQARELEERAALPCANPSADALPVPCNEGAEAMSAPRRSGGIGGSEQ